MLVEPRHVFLELQRNLMHGFNTPQGAPHHLRAGLGLFPGFGRGRGRGRSIPGHFLHSGVHLVHGRGGLGKPLGGLGRALVGLLNLGGQLS